jgi:hypothetical protein
LSLSAAILHAAGCEVLSLLVIVCNTVERKKYIDEVVLRDSATRFSTSGFFHESVSLKLLSIPLGPFQISGYIRSSTCTTGVNDTAISVNDTGGKWKKSSIRNILIILF